MRLLRIVMADRRAVAVAEDLEHRKRAAQQRVDAGARLDHDELARAPQPPRSPARPARARCSRSTAGGSRSPPRRHRPASRQYTAAKLVLSLWALVLVVVVQGPGLARKDQGPTTKDQVRYLRMLCNSMAAAALATAYVIALVLHLNPHLPLNPARLAPLATTVGLFYVVHLTVDLLHPARRCGSSSRAKCFRRRGSASACWSWLGAVASAAGAALMWQNLRDVRAGPRRRDRRRRSIAARSC